MDRRTRRTTPYLFRFGLPAAALLTVAACSNFSPPSTQELALACPHISIVRDLKTTTQFRSGTGRDASDVAARGEIVDYAGNCEYGKDGVTVNLDLLLAAEKGPAMTGNQVEFKYFVAVARPGETEPAAKEVFNAPLVFPAGEARTASKEQLTPHIPLPADVNAKGWTVLIGFQLSNDELKYNLTAGNAGQK